jgi:hypothetical protein
VIKLTKQPALRHFWTEYSEHSLNSDYAELNGGAVSEMGFRMRLDKCRLFQGWTVTWLMSREPDADVVYVLRNPSLSLFESVFKSYFSSAPAFSSAYFKSKAPCEFRSIFWIIQKRKRMSPQ